MRKLLFQLLLSSTPFMVWGQQISAPSPDAMAMVHSMSVPVNHFTGTAGVNVPIYTVQSSGGVQVPISLNYNGSGIRVNQVASSVGLGWQLAAGGAITRVVRGKPDWSKPNIDRGLSSYNLHKNLVNGDDGEKDIFYFSYPGNQGSFIIKDPDPNEIMPIASYQPLVWQDITIVGGPSGFKIVDAYGNQYIFGTSPNSLEISKINSTSGSTYNSSDEIEYISTWYLDEIIPFGEPASRSVRFTYSSQQNYLDENFSYNREIHLDCYDTEIPQNSITYKTKNSLQGRSLVSIVYPFGQVLFNYSTNRLDAPGLFRLDKIVVKKNNVIESEYSLNYGYFDASDSFYKSGGFVGKYSSLISSCVNSKCKRLKLNSLYQKSGNQEILLREFDYMNDKTFDANFGFDVYELPPRDSYYTDHWGYFNGSTHYGTIYANHKYQIGSGATDSRSPKISAKANSLSKIKYGTGGYTNLEYNVKDGGGLSISAIRHYNDNDFQIGGTSFSYQGYIEHPFSKPIYRHISDEFIQLYCGSSQPTFKVKTVEYSNSVGHYFDINGSNHGYEKVIETDINGSGSIEHEFVKFSERTESSISKYIYNIDICNNNTFSSYPVSHYYMPFNVKNLQYHDIGTERKTTVKDGNGITKQISERIFTKETPVVYTIKNYAIDDLKKVGATCKFKMNVAVYDIFVRPVWVTSELSTSYEGNGNLASSTLIEYHSVYKSLPFRVTSANAEGNYVQTVTRFPIDILGSGSVSASASLEVKALERMMNFHQAKGLPIETLTYQKDKLADPYKIISSSFSTYKEYNTGTSNSYIKPLNSYGLVLDNPSSTFTSLALNGTKTSFVFDSKYEIFSTLNSFDTHGNLLVSTDKMGTQTTYTYDPAGLMLLSTNTNGFISTNEYNNEYQLIKSTDTNGRNVSYEYDGFNRVKLVRDHDNNIIQRTRYHFKTEDVNMNTNLGFTGFNKPNQTITFTTDNTQAFYGPTRFIWDFGNGVTRETSTPTTTYSYPTATTYKTSVTLINPEYPEPAHYKRDLTVYSNNMVPQICGSSTTWNSCTLTPGNDGLCLSQNTTELSYKILNEGGGAHCLPANFNYTWYYKMNGTSNWIWFADGSSEVILASSYLPFDGNFQIKCVMNDDCGTYESNLVNLQVTSDCNQGGSGPGIGN